jgi:N utilization substance protein B
VTPPRGSSRHRSREAALQVLYAVDLSRRAEAALPVAAEEMFESAGEHFELPEGARAFAKELVLGVARHRADLDEVIGRYAQRWKIARMAAVDRNILRLGAYELLHSDAPAPVVIDEAVELARRFAGDRSPAFVNGILDAVARSERAPAETKGAPPAAASDAGGGAR